MKPASVVQLGQDASGTVAKRLAQLRDIQPQLLAASPRKAPLSPTPKTPDKTRDTVTRQIVGHLYRTACGRPELSHTMSREKAGRRIMSNTAKAWPIPGPKGAPSLLPRELCCRNCSPQDGPKDLSPN